jgi:hypothetical protein
VTFPLGRLARLERLLPEPPPLSPFAAYRGRPLDYVREVLRQRLWPAQEQILRLLFEPPYKVAAKSCHKVGKSFLAACLICYFYDCFAPSLTITTAPTKEAVCDQLWREVRILRAGAGLGGFPGEAAPELWSAHDHWAKGLTAKSGEAFQGKHQLHMLFVIDEAVGVAPWVFDVMRSMFKPNGTHHWLIIGNPTDTASQMYAEELNVNADGGPAWSWVTMAAPDHPNLAAELRGEPPPFPSAVSLAQFEGWLADWCDPIVADEATATDLQWPPAWYCAAHGLAAQWYRPGPEMEARGLGRWPSSGTYGVWSDALWQAALSRLGPPLDVPQVGCDVARYGEDYTEMHVRCGPCSLHHERHNGWGTDRTAGRLKELAGEWVEWHNGRLDPAAQKVRPQEVPVKVDDGGVGGGVTDQRGDYDFRPVIAQSGPADGEKYPDCRSELWFVTAGRARQGRLDLSRLTRDTLRRLRQQAMAPTWKQDGSGRRAVESKADTKKRLSCGSPDGMDSVNLAYYEAPAAGAAVADARPDPRRRQGDGRREEPRRGGRSHFGYR